MTELDNVQLLRSTKSGCPISIRGFGTDDLRAAAALADERSEVSISLALLWKELSLGLCRVVDSFSASTRLFLVTRAVPGKAVQLAPTHLRVLQAVLGGACQNSVSIDLSIAPSTVAARARAGLERMGMRQLPSHASPLLMLAARSACQLELKLAGSVSFIEHQGEQLRVVGLRRPDVAPPGVSPAELAVVRGIVEGLTYDEIAGLRGTSKRTIANQLASVFRRLCVSGRSALILRLFDAQPQAQTEKMTSGTAVTS